MNSQSGTAAQLLQVSFLRQDFVFLSCTCILLNVVYECLSLPPLTHADIFHIFRKDGVWGTLEEAWDIA
jgi:hypothetical protein